MHLPLSNGNAHVTGAVLSSWLMENQIGWKAKTQQSPAFKTFSSANFFFLKFWVCISYPIEPDNLVIQQHIFNPTSISGYCFPYMNTHEEEVEKHIYIHSDWRDPDTSGCFEGQIDTNTSCPHLPLLSSATAQATSTTNKLSLWVAHFLTALQKV